MNDYKIAKEFFDMMIANKFNVLERVLSNNGMIDSKDKFQLFQIINKDGEIVMEYDGDNGYWRDQIDCLKYMEKK